MTEDPTRSRDADALAAVAAARALEALVPPLRFALRGAGRAARLVGFGATVRAAVARARALGAPDSPALRRLEAEAEGFDVLAPAGRKRALARTAAHLSALVPLPAELAEIARAARIEMMGGKGRRAEAGPLVAPSPRPSPPLRGGEGGTPRPPRQDPSPAEERVTRRRPPARPDSSPSPPAAAAGEGRGEGGQNPSATPLAAPEPEWREAPPPSSAEERAARRRRLATRLEALVPRVHPSTRGQLEERGRRTVEEALEFWPRAYQDRSRLRRVAELRPGDEGIVLATVAGVRTQRMRNGRPLLKVAATDPSAALDLVFFNPPPWRQRQFQAGDSLLAWGKVTEGFGRRRQMAQPEVEKVTTGDSASFGRIVPVYPGPADYQHPALRRLMKRLVDELAPLVPDDLPAEVLARRGLLSRARALREAHFPPPGTDVALAAARATPAFRRLVFEELFFLQLALALRRRGVRAEPGIVFDASPEAVRRAVGRLPFALTRAQERALAEIARDMGRPEPMNRLLQGDVGSGKTAVAFAAMMLAVESGWQAALMVPTEILAEQHAGTLRGWLEGSGVELALVGAAARGKAQRAARAAVADGRARLAVGTHALLEEDVAFERLGLVVVDEQHRFGVMQRLALIAKGRRPDVLVLTATPIPRTLAMAFYGDLDHSKIDELPPGRAPVLTRVFGDSQRRAAYDVARKELEAGRQAYVVYPLVGESAKTDLADATTGAARLEKDLPGHAVGLLHGQMKAGEKQAVMERFRAGELRVLVATTVIEVGVDVPNATVMIVEHAERFGLSQLHQLRGRVGRGAARGHCLLLAHHGRAGEDARERLRAIERTNDGFELAREDLRIRGQGEMLGTRQSGQTPFEIADLYRDEAILDEAREEAFRLVERDPHLSHPDHRAAAEALRLRWAERLSLAQVG